MFLRDLQRSLYFHYEIKIVSGAVLFKNERVSDCYVIRAFYNLLPFLGPAHRDPRESFRDPQVSFMLYGR